jgi:UDP-2,3-diacylglucosamine pyrophosphatase LpxH
MPMGLGRMWRRVRSLSERPHNLLAISDLHLGCDLRPGNKLDRPRPTDAPLAQFIDYHARHRDGGKPWRLILNGDIVDFVAVTLVPKEPAPFEISVEERALGLAPTGPKCVWKLRRTAERHPDVFDALARFVHRGNSVHIIRGNHDAEWRWPAVQEEFRRILAERSGAPRRKIDRLVEFHDWFYLEPGFFYAEHGHAHDQYSVQTEFFSAHNDDSEIELPLSSKVLRYFVNRYTEQVEVADDVDTWGLKEYLDWVLRAGNPLRVFRVIYPLIRQSLKISRAFARAADKALSRKVERNAHVRQILTRFQGTDKQAQQLAEIASRPAEHSLFDSMQLFYLDRMLLAVACLLMAWTLARGAEGFWGKSAVLTCVGIVFAALNAVLGKRRRTDAHPMLREAARRVAQIFDVKYVVMGHSHRAVEEPAGNGTRYFNLGSWTPGRSNDGFPHVVVTGGSAELRRWKGPPLVELPPPDEEKATVPVPA